MLKFFIRINRHFTNKHKCKLLINSVIKRGGVFAKGIKLVVDGYYSFGFGCSFQVDGIDNYGNAQIMILSGGILTIGNNSGFAASSIVCTYSITIGNNVKIGAGCLIMDSNFHSIDFIERRSGLTDKVNALRKPIVIEDDVFIGARCIINKGVHIGTRTIISSGSVVVSDLPPDCICGGNPCKVIKQLSNNK